MSICKQCQLPPKVPDEGGVLVLAPSLAHTVGKLFSRLQESDFQAQRPRGDVLKVSTPAGRLEALFSLLAGALSAAELEGCNALLLTEDRPLDFQDLSRMGPLNKLMARSDSSWLLDMIRDDRLFMHFQPIVRARAPQTPFAYESLLRGHDAAGATVYPDKIFGTARSAELLFQVDRAARLTAIRDVGRHGINVPVFINFNPTSIYDPAYCLRTTIKAIQEAGLSPDQIVFEVVESDKVADAKHLLNIVTFYRQEGFRIALDDLGAGYSSLNLLSQLKPDFIKFDRELVTAIDENPYKQKVFGKLLEMAQDLRVQTICEGVETEEEYAWLLQGGVDYLQGYLFAKPSSPPPLPIPLKVPARAPSRAQGSVPSLGASSGISSSGTSLLDVMSLDASLLTGGLLQSVLDSLTEQVAVLDSSGKIGLVNEAWRRFGAQNGAPADRYLGMNYLDVCRLARDEGIEDARESYDGIKGVLAGSSGSYSREYLCDTPEGVRWFMMLVTPLKAEDGGAVILHVDITTRKKGELEVQHLAHHDLLTGAANRHYFYKRAQDMLTEAEAQVDSLALFYFDLDGFKTINDTYGHAAGDELLRAVVSRLRAQSRGLRPPGALWRRRVRNAYQGRDARGGRERRQEALRGARAALFRQGQASRRPQLLRNRLLPPPRRNLGRAPPPRRPRHVRDEAPSWPGAPAGGPVGAVVVGGVARDVTRDGARDGVGAAAGRPPSKVATEKY